MGVTRLFAFLCYGLLALPSVTLATPHKNSAHRPQRRKSGPQRRNRTPAKQANPVTRQPAAFAQTVLSAEDLAVPITRTYSISQGKTLHLKIRMPNDLTSASTNCAGTTYTFSPVPGRDGFYESFIPFDCEYPAGKERLIIKAKTAGSADIKSLGCEVTINPFVFKKQRGFKVSQKKLHSIKRAGIGGGRESKLLAKYIQNSPKQKLWSGPFELPINLQHTTSSFGEIRKSHGMGVRHHRGIDITDYPKAPIHAAKHGIVAVKTTTPVNGNMIAIDHGLGVFTLYCHMDSFDKKIAIGSPVTKGQRIGRIGMTGYASGYHLHLEMRVQNIAVDFMEWTKQIY